MARTCLITGGAQGIGASIAREFSLRGYNIVILDIDEEACQENKDYILQAGGNCVYYAIDIKDEQAIIGVMQELAESDVIIDVLINNAGISLQTPLDSPISTWDIVINTNLRGAYLLVKHGLARLKPGSSIINIASTRATMSEPDWHAYAAAKGGLVSLTHSLAISLGVKGIRVNAISPGWVDVSEWQKSSNRQSVKLRECDLMQHAVGRVGKPEDVAAACIFLSSDDAGFITGANLVIDGGMTVKMIYEK
ncbi:SDR family NAD(P)-dependent oxidoreductase [Dendrosporobacter sp. 1207_IL3150]|uniref:SDR family NAD(P)-dependent oxidoreductase n=1 Tax=Dendrosporobacter sp. 1207_IL3150 TaxID=3084054 RepID=UPI002FDA1D5A